MRPARPAARLSSQMDSESSRASSQRSASLFVGGCLLVLTAVTGVAQQQPLQFGGAYSGLGERRQHLVDDWLARLKNTTGQSVEPAAFYDELLPVSKTTFDAVTHALMTTPLTDAAGTALAGVHDALALIEHVDSISGQVPGASGDRQFRIYVRLIPDALDTLARSQQFKRGVDNFIFHKGYPTNYRAEGGAPSIQISIAPDRHRADIDVDYRSSSFPLALFNGHLSAANSDVRAGDNIDRHDRRWSGLQNWWRGFLGVNLQRAPDDERPSALALPRVPRAGKKNIDVMANDFLSAWLVEGDVLAAMGYISERAYACVGQDADDASPLDRGMAPFQLLMNLKAAHDTLGQRPSLDGLLVGVRLNTPSLKVVQQRHHAQFVLYAVPDDVAAGFDCETRMAPGGAKKPARAYGNYFGSTFFVDGHANQRVALLWAKDNGYWKIVSWMTGVDEVGPAADTDAVTITRVKADAGFAAAAQAFLQTWLIKKDYDAAFRYLSPAAYACYDLTRNPADPPSTSPEDAGRKIRAGLERAGQLAGPARSLDTILAAAEPIHPAVRVMDHAQSRTFSLTSIPNAIGDAVECDARGRGALPPDPLPLEYGKAFGLTVRVGTGAGGAPVLRMLWRNEEGVWRIRSYDLELP
jgi:hypothetical protein